VEVSVSYFPADELQAAFESASSGSIAPSVLLGPAAWGPELYAQGLVQEVDDLVDPELRQAVYPIAWGQVAIEGALVGLPIELQGVVLYRNGKLAGEPAATLEDLIAAAQTLSPQGAGLDFGFVYSASQLAACGGGLFGPEGEPGFGGSVGLCWLGLLTEFSRAGPVTFNSDQDLELFESGQVAWLMETTARADRLRQAIGESNLVVDPWPVYAATGDRMAGFVWTENAYLSAALDPKDLEVAWAFARFVVSPQAQRILSETLGIGHVPVLQSLEVDQPRLSQARAILSRGVPMPRTQDLTPIAEALEWAARVVAVQGGDPAVALEGALGLLRQDLVGPTPEG
jgi:maltose-binding protein MalE